MGMGSDPGRKLEGYVGVVVKNAKARYRQVLRGCKISRNQGGKMEENCHCAEKEDL